MGELTLTLSQELDKLLNKFEQCKTVKGADRVKLEIEAKRKELNASIMYNEYLSSVLDPRD